MIKAHLSTGKTVMIANRFNDLSLDQVITYVTSIEMRRGLLFDQEEGKTVIKDPELMMRAQLELLRSLLPITDREFFAITPAQLRDLLVEEELCKFFFHDLMSRNPLPTLKTGFMRRLYGPESDFHRLSFAEFGFADDAFLKYQESSQEAHLNQLIAIMYRARKDRFEKASFDTDGDIREPFNYLTTDFRIPAIEKIPIKMRLAIHLWFSHCRLAMLKHYAPVFEKRDQDLEDGEKQSWIHTAMNIGGGLINFHSTSRQPVYLVFEEMKRLVLERSRLEEELKNRNHGSS